MMTITYPVYNGIYVNMTNRCPCACTFCLRKQSDHVYGSDSLWLEREPTVEEVCESIDKWDLSKYTHVTSDMQKSASAVVGNMMQKIMIKE